MRPLPGTIIDWLVADKVPREPDWWPKGHSHESALLVLYDIALSVSPNLRSWVQIKPVDFIRLLAVSLSGIDSIRGSILFAAR